MCPSSLRSTRLLELIDAIQNKGMKIIIFTTTVNDVCFLVEVSSCSLSLSLSLFLSLSLSLCLSLSLSYDGEAELYSEFGNGGVHKLVL